MTLKIVSKNVIKETFLPQINFMLYYTETNVFKYIMGIIAENKNIYYPVHTEMITEKSQWNYWFIIGWHVSI